MIGKYTDPDGIQRTQRSDGIWSSEGTQDRALTAPATDDAKRWQGWGTALKPACEFWTLARKPLSKGLTVAENCLKWGTGALNIDGTRIGPPQNTKVKYASNADAKKTMGAFDEWDGFYREQTQGRWPANVLFDEEAAAMLDEQSGESTARGGKPKDKSDKPGAIAFSGESEYIADARRRIESA